MDLGLDMELANISSYLPHQQLIFRKMNCLVPIIDVARILKGLVLQQLITFNELPIFMGPELSAHLKAKKVLEIVAGKGQIHFSKFINCLVNADQREAVGILDPALVLPDSEGDVTDGGVIYGKTVFRPPEHDVYVMLENPRGNALVISNTIFDDPVLYPHRIGGEKDEHSMDHLLDRFQFNVSMHKNKKKYEMEKLLKTFRAMDHSRANAAVIVIMSHGEERGIVGVDGHCLSVQSIVDNFTSDNCPQLGHKPKMFFFQACRGHKKDFGNFVPVSNTRSNGQSAQHDGRRLQEEPAVVALVPNYCHMKVCHSSYKGYQSMRNPDHGAWFIQSIVEIFGKKAHEMPLDALLRLVSQKVHDLGVEANCLQTVDINQHGWQKELYFNPGFSLKPQF